MSKKLLDLHKKLSEKLGVVHESDQYGIGYNDGIIDALEEITKEIPEEDRPLTIKGRG